MFDYPSWPRTSNSPFPPRKKNKAPINSDIKAKISEKRSFVSKYFWKNHVDTNKNAAKPTPRAIKLNLQASYNRFKEKLVLTLSIFILALQFSFFLIPKEQATYRIPVIFVLFGVLFGLITPNVWEEIKLWGFTDE